MYVSCEIKKSKASGELFDYVLDDLKVNPGTVETCEEFVSDNAEIYQKIAEEEKLSIKIFG